MNGSLCFSESDGLEIGLGASGKVMHDGVEDRSKERIPDEAQALCGKARATTAPIVSAHVDSLCAWSKPITSYWARYCATYRLYDPR